MLTLKCKLKYYCDLANKHKNYCQDVTAFLTCKPVLTTNTTKTPKKRYFCQKKTFGKGLYNPNAHFYVLMCTQ